MANTFENIKIRTLVEADVYFLSQYLMDPAVLDFFPMCNMTEVQEAVKIWLFYARKGQAYTVEVNNIPAGMAVLYVNTFKKLSKQALFAIVIGEKFRGKGIGTKFLKFLIKQAKQTYGIVNLHLEMYENNPAYSLYKRFGFKDYGVHEKFMREQCSNKKKKKLMMQLDLTDVEID